MQPFSQTLSSGKSVSVKFRFIRNVSFKGMADLVSRLATFFITVFLTRKLDQNQFGLLSYALTLAMSWALLMDFGWNNVLIRQTQKEHLKSLFLTVFILKAVIFCFVIILVVLVPSLLPRSEEHTSELQS